MTKHSARDQWETLPSPNWSNTDTSLASLVDSAQSYAPNELAETKEALRQSKCVVDNLKVCIKDINFKYI